MSNPSPQQLRDILANHFNLGELRSLSFNLGIEYEDLEGGSKSGKTLVQYAQRHGRYADLVKPSSRRAPASTRTRRKRGRFPAAPRQAVNPNNRAAPPSSSREIM